MTSRPEPPASRDGPANVPSASAGAEHVHAHPLAPRADADALHKRVNRIEGQVRGIAAMIEEDRYCADIIQQCAAVQESLRSVAKNLLRNHLGHCTSRAMHGDKQQQDAMVEELIELVGRIAR